ncbi:MAG: hypothetical protein HN855_09450 [Anaerolineae bacterium]|jgi:hypothetical protein|nr:hypothetical protein [Anaerolineae bacterium]MBT7069408.1 hypothetical protein [Anaerolineae bacterium]MBT7325372.1 hypothetical protein [Anaerolineae bacterium]
MKKKILVILFVLSLVVSACGNLSEADAEMIATSAAQTVEARFTQMAESTSTPEPTPEEEPVTEETPSTATATPTAPPISEIAPEGCLVASFAGETIPDGTVVETGQYFTKSWTIVNSGTCTWHKGYKLIYWDGNLLGGAAEYEFFDEISPGETMTFPIQLLAPSEAGVYESFWKFKSPSGYIFGVGQSNTPVSVNISVGNPGDLEYGITSVHYTLQRDPEFGCPANVRWKIIATITVNGPMTVVAQFQQSDGNHTVKKTKVFTEASSQNMSVTWTLNKGATANPRWVQLVVFEPDYQEYPTYTFVNNCPDQTP